jgi:hypothetical protein
LPQAGWSYLDTNGRYHKVGLYHGDQSGHVIVYCDMRIIQLDFSVTETRMYSFFIEDELVELYLTRQPEGHFVYDFRMNQEVDTPLNRIRKTEERRDRRFFMRTVIGLGILLTAVICFGLWNRYRGAPNRHFEVTWSGSQASPMVIQRLTTEGRSAVATFMWDSLAKPYQVRCVFHPNGVVQPIVHTVVDTFGLERIMTPTGFALQHQDAFTVRYFAGDPKTYFVDFQLPTPATVANYTNQAVMAEARRYPAYPLDILLCRVQVIIEKRGWNSLPSVIGPNTPDMEAKYQQMIESPDIKSSIDLRCF